MVEQHPFYDLFAEMKYRFTRLILKARIAVQDARIAALSARMAALNQRYQAQARLADSAKAQKKAA